MTSHQTPMNPHGASADDVDGANSAAGARQASESAAITAERFKELLAHLAGAVVVITTRDADGHVWGFTASSFCSLSLDPPLVLFCLEQSADCHAAFMAADSFAVSMLAAHQVELSQRFAMKGSIKYEGVRLVEGALGMPLISGALVWLECVVYARYPGGDHTIVVGRVESGDVNALDAGARPLLYYNRAYGGFAPREAEPPEQHEHVESDVSRT